MTSKERQLTLYGRAILTGQVRAVSGLHIGASKDTLDIGGVDMPVIRNPHNRHPYIPGSSLKGKMRSLWEKVSGVAFNFQIGRSRNTTKQVWIHMCNKRHHDPECPVCTIYGTTGDAPKKAPTRLTVRDIPIDPDSLSELVIDYAEVKWEAAIDRVTSAATPRQAERVPAGAIFKPLELVFNFYEAADVTRFSDVLRGLRLVTDDYLGGHGSRGAGKVAFEELTLTLKYGKQYIKETDPRFQSKSLVDLWAAHEAMEAWLREKLAFDGGA